MPELTKALKAAIGTIGLSAKVWQLPKERGPRRLATT